MNTLELINAGSSRLKSKNIFTHKLDSELLLSEVLKKTREEILINLNAKMSQIDIIKFKNLINRRAKKEPIAYILKYKEFWSKKFQIDKSTLIPRPETELMIEYLINVFKRKKINILDIGTGSGCILISLLAELINSKGIGVDISEKALIIANKNVLNHKLSNKVKLLNRSFEKIYDKKFDLIVSNPPYIKTSDIKNLAEDVRNFEPKIALDGGNDGLDLIKKVIYKSTYILKLDGLLALEIGNNQYKKVSNLLIRNKFKIVKKVKDYRDNIRCLISKLIKWGKWTIEEEILDQDHKKIILEEEARR